MSDTFFEYPILNSPYACPERHWQLENGLPTGSVVGARRRAEFITPIPKPRKQKSVQPDLLDETLGLSRDGQKYDPISLINEIRTHVDAWRALPQGAWQVTPETERLLAHWRSHEFQSMRPFFCQIEAVETAIWLTEVAPKLKAQESQRKKTGASKSGALDPFDLPLKLQTALGALYDHYEKTFRLWEQAQIKVPPCFIIVCNNTSTSKLVYDYVSGFLRETEEGARILENGRLELFQSDMRLYLPDFILRIDDGKGQNEDDLLNLIVEIKGYRGEDAKDKKSTMETYWIPGVNNLKTWGRWAFAEFTNVWAMESDFAAVLKTNFDNMLTRAISDGK